MHFYTDYRIQTWRKVKLVLSLNMIVKKQFQVFEDRLTCQQLFQLLIFTFSGFCKKVFFTTKYETAMFWK